MKKSQRSLKKWTNEDWGYVTKGDGKKTKSKSKGKRKRTY